LGVIGELGKVARRYPRSRTKSRAGRVIATALARVGCSAVQVAELRDGSRLLLDARGRTEASPFWNGEYDSDDIAFFKASFTPTRSFIDIGANVGLIAIPIASHICRTLAAGRVVAVEPVPANMARLRRSVALEPCVEQHVIAVEAALGAQSGTVSLVSEREGKTSNAAVSILGTRGSAIRDVAQRTLDEVLEDLAIVDVDVIKMDVEGYELEVLKGAAQCLAEQRPIIYGEFNNQLMPSIGVTFLDVVALTRPLGYRYFAFVDRCLTREVTEPDATLGNAVLVPTERVDEWLSRLENARLAGVEQR